MEMPWAVEQAIPRLCWGALLVLWASVRRRLWLGLREAPTSRPGASDARGFAADVACTAAVEKRASRAAQGSPRPRPGSLEAPVQLEQLHGPSEPAVPLVASGRAPRTCTCPRRDSRPRPRPAPAPPPPGPGSSAPPLAPPRIQSLPGCGQPVPQGDPPPCPQLWSYWLRVHPSPRPPASSRGDVPSLILSLPTSPVLRSVRVCVSV